VDKIVVRGVRMGLSQSRPAISIILYCGVSMDERSSKNWKIVMIGLVKECMRASDEVSPS